jgi:hypothetical protein
MPFKKTIKTKKMKQLLTLTLTLTLFMVCHAQTAQFDRVSTLSVNQIPRYNSLTNATAAGSRPGNLVFVYDGLDSGVHVRSFDNTRWIKVNAGGGGGSINLFTHDLTLSDFRTHDLSEYGLRFQANDVYGLNSYYDIAAGYISLQGNKPSINVNFQHQQSTDRFTYDVGRLYPDNTFRKAAITGYVNESVNTPSQVTLQSDSIYLWRTSGFGYFPYLPTIHSLTNDYRIVAMDQTTGALVTTPSSSIGVGGEQHLYYNPIVRSFYSTNSIAAANGGTLENMRNIAIGDSALRDISNNNDNVAIGFNSQRKNSGGQWNTAVGTGTLTNNILGISNSAFGTDALFSSIGSANSAFGTASMSSATTASNSCAFGDNTLANVTTGQENSAFGQGALGSLVTGGFNVALGKDAGYWTPDPMEPEYDIANYGSSNSIYVGYNCKSGTATSTNEIVIGSEAIGNGSNTTTIGNSSTNSTKIFGRLNIGTVPEYAGNAAAISGGLVAGDVYRTGDALKVVH